MLLGLEIDPNEKGVLNLLVQSLDDAGRHAEALVSLKKAIKLDPKYAAGYYDLGVILARKKDKRDEAMRCFKKALSLSSPMITPLPGRSIPLPAFTPRPAAGRMRLAF
jgi:tetratricopeptide (TPR) repeat protein